MSSPWLAILSGHAQTRGQAAVARELGVSPGAVSLVLSGKYQASTQKIEDRVMRIYGAGGKITCPVLGRISPARCVGMWESARKIGGRAGNPATIRQYITCRKCPVRN